MLKIDVRTGMSVQFDHRGRNYRGVVIKVLPKNVMMKGTDGKCYRVDPHFLRACDDVEVEEDVFVYDRSNISTNTDLKRLLEEVKDEYSGTFTKIFNAAQLEKLASVKIHFGTRVTHRKFGSYRTSTNTIYITKTLQRAPEYAIKEVIHHELLHIRWGHTTIFRIYEREFKEFDKASEFNKKLARSVLVHGDAALNFDAPVKQVKKKREPEPETIVEKKPEPTEGDPMLQRFKEIQARLARQRASRG